MLSTHFSNIFDRTTKFPGYTPHSQDDSIGGLAVAARQSFARADFELVSRDMCSHKTTLKKFFEIPVDNVAILRRTAVISGDNAKWMLGVSFGGACDRSWC